jgi:hypothetical protein
MTIRCSHWFRLVIALILIAGSGISVRPQVVVGTWTRKPDANAPKGMTMIVEECCGGGRRLTYKIPDIKSTLVVESKLDGSDAPVMMDGKPSGETMAIRKIDDRHATAVVKMNGKAFGTSKGTISADGKTLIVESDFSESVGGGPVGKFTETWTRN